MDTSVTVKSFPLLDTASYTPYIPPCPKVWRSVNLGVVLDSGKLLPKLSWKLTVMIDFQLCSVE